MTQIPYKRGVILFFISSGLVQFIPSEEVEYFPLNPTAMKVLFLIETEVGWKKSKFVGLTKLQSSPLVD